MNIFEIFSMFDWITPAVGFVEDIVNDPTPLQSNSWTFFIPYDEMKNSGWSAFDIENLMDKHGIKRWGSQITNGDFFFSVNLEQARWAEYVLLQYSVPITKNSADPPRPQREMNNVTDFAPTGLTKTGPVLPIRVLRWLFGGEQ